MIKREREGLDQPPFNEGDQIEIVPQGVRA